MNYHNITKDDMKNGEGLRVVLWVSGCAHACVGCHNKITWDCSGGLEFDENAKAELYEALDKEYISGITFSGGDPLHPNNRNEIEKLILEIKERFPLKTIWLYTGYMWEEIKDLSYISFIDIVVDGRFVLKLKDERLPWKGSSNQRVIDVKRSLLENSVILYKGE